MLSFWGSTWASPGGRKQFAFVVLCFWKVPLLTRSTSGLVVFCGSKKGVWSWSAGHYGLIWFANLFRGRFALGSLIRVSTESDPYKPKNRQKCIRYGDFGAKSPVPFTPPGPPPGPPPVLLPLAACKAAFGGLSLSLSLSRFPPASAGHFCTADSSCHTLASS